MDGEFIGLDVGGTKIASATLEDGKLETHELVKTDVSDSDKLVAQIVELIAHLRSDDTVAVGVGLPSIIEFETGRIAHSVNIPLADLPLRELLSDKAGIPVYLENDASCAALAEAFDEAGKLVCPNLVMLTVGTGVGGGLVFNGRLYRGATSAGELGHTVIGLDLEDGRADARGQAPAAGDARVPRGGPRARPARRARGARGGGLVPRQAARAGRRGHRPRRRRRRQGRATPTRCACSTSSASASASGSPTRSTSSTRRRSSSAAASRWPATCCSNPAKRVAKEYTVPGLGLHTTIRLARHGAQAGVLGAAMVAAHEEEGR